MTAERLALPLIALTAIGYGITRLCVRVHPRVASRMITVVMVLGALSAVPILVHGIAGGMSALPRVGGNLHDSLHSIGVHGLADPTFGLASAILVGWTMWTMTRHVLAGHAIGKGRVPGLVIEQSDELFAYAVPGKSGAVSISRGLRRILTPIEFEAVVAHEVSHVRLRHDRLLVLSRLCTCMNPLLIPLRGPFRYVLERVADEYAASRVGDRGVVARALEKAADGAALPRWLPSVAPHGVASRIVALSGPQTHSRAVSLAGWIGVLTAAASAVLAWQVSTSLAATACGV